MGMANLETAQQSELIPLTIAAVLELELRYVYPQKPPIKKLQQNKLKPEQETWSTPKAASDVGSSRCHLFCGTETVSNLVFTTTS